MDIEKIRKAKTEQLGKQIVYQNQMTSTQEEAKKVAKEAENGTLFLAEKQTNGKGTKGRSWHTGEGKNIAMSLILKPNATIDQFSDFTIDVAKILVEAVFDKYKYRLTIKEPNDLLLNGKKIAGILTEASTIKGKINYIVLGIGINVNEEDFSEETIQIATSLKKEMGIELEREEILVCFLEKLEEYLKELNK